MVDGLGLDLKGSPRLLFTHSLDVHIEDPRRLV